MTTLRTYFELVRLPNTFTAVADVLAGYWLVSGAMRWDVRVACLALASASLYAAGIVFNDLRDVEADRAERPDRPLPSGRIGRGHAITLAIVLLFLGLCLAGGTGLGFVRSGEPTELAVPAWRPGLAAVALVIAILAYDFLLKGTLLGPLSMGLCRGLNLLMAMCVAWWFTLDLFLVAILGMIHYVASITYFGFEEARLSGRFRLATGGCGVIVGVLLLGLIAAWNDSGSDLTLILWLAFLVHLSRMVYRAVRNPSGAQVRYAMKNFILGIIVFDAILASASAGTAAGLVVLSLLVPTLLIGRRIYST